MTRSIFKTLCRSAAIAAVPALMLLASPAHAEIYSIAGTDCHSQSTGVVYTVTQVRNEQASNRSVYCSFPVSTAGTSIYFYAWLKNTGAVERTINCTIMVGNPVNGYETAAMSHVLAAGSGSAVSTNIERNTYWSAMGVVCTLPPKTALDNIYIDVTTP